MLRRTHLSWFNSHGGKESISEIVAEFDIDNIESETINEIIEEGLIEEIN